MDRIEVVETLTDWGYSSSVGIGVLVVIERSSGFEMRGEGVRSGEKDSKVDWVRGRMSFDS